MFKFLHGEESYDNPNKWQRRLDRHSIHGKFTTEDASTFLSIYKLAVSIH